eukprot:1948886-Pyramimonas_sp.AAC.1
MHRPQPRRSSGPPCIRLPARPPRGAPPPAAQLLGAPRSPRRTGALRRSDPWCARGCLALGGAPRRRDRAQFEKHVSADPGKNWGIDFLRNCALQ